MMLVPAPRVHPVVLVVCGLINFILPGVGLMIAACIANDPARLMSEFWMGLTMLMLSFFFIGVIWSWIDGAVMIFIAFTRPWKARGGVEDPEQRAGYGTPAPQNNANVENAQVKQRKKVEDFGGHGRKI